MLNNSEKLYSQYENYTVAVFGSARLDISHDVYQSAYVFAVELAKLHCNIVTGAGPGVMEAANSGLLSVREENSKSKSVGLHIKLTHETKANNYLDESYYHENFFTRLSQFTDICDSFVVFDGGIGTLLEILIVLQLMQVGKVHDKKLILVGDMWYGLLDWMHTQMIRDDAQMISLSDLKIMEIVSDYNQALMLVQKHKKELNK